jgi:hypothetical protein
VDTASWLHSGTFAVFGRGKNCRRFWAYIVAGLKGESTRKRLGGAARASSGESELSAAAMIVTSFVILACGAIVGAVLWFGVWAMLW